MQLVGLSWKDAMPQVQCANILYFYFCAFTVI